MTHDHSERFVRNQLAGLADLGLDAEALAREENLLRSGFVQSEALSAVFAQFNHPPLEGSAGRAGGQARPGRVEIFEQCEEISGRARP